MLGDPGAGKATQTTLLAKKYSFFDFDMGRELTLQRQKNSKIDAIHKKITDKGNLTPTKIVRGIIREKLGKLSSTNGIVFDGHPKMVGEAKLIVGLLKKAKRPDPLVIYLTIPQGEVVKRISQRKGYYNTKFSKRSDDSIQALKNRAKYYKTNIKQVTSFLDKIYRFVRINGLGSRAVVRAKIQKAIKEHLK